MLRAQWTCRSCTRALLARCSGPRFARFSSTVSESTLAPGLLRRAKALASEHDELKKMLDGAFDTATAKRAGELQRVAAALQEWESATESIAELRSMADEGAATGNQQDADLAAIAREELEGEKARLEGLERELTASLTPRHPFADLPCMLEIRPGPGGLEGRYFADRVFKMYRALCERRGYRAKVVKYDMSETAGDQTSAEGEMPLQEAILEVADEGAYGIFRAEAGMHRVQRIPSTENKGRVHTSAVAVWVLPSSARSGSGAGAEEKTAQDDPQSDFYVDPSEVRVEAMRARGAGGQHVNKTESAIRLTHMPTGTAVSMQDHRSQQRNREEAWRLLRARLAAQRAERREEEAAALRDNVLAASQITRGDKIRTYNYSQDRCTDHRAAVDVHDLPVVLDGGPPLDRIMQAAADWLLGREVAALIAEEEANAKTTLAAAAAATKKKK